MRSRVPPHPRPHPPSAACDFILVPSMFEPCGLTQVHLKGGGRGIAVTYPPTPTHPPTCRPTHPPTLPRPPPPYPHARR